MYLNVGAADALILIQLTTLQDVAIDKPSETDVCTRGDTSIVLADRLGAAIATQIIRLAPAGIHQHFDLNVARIRKIYVVTYRWMQVVKVSSSRFLSLEICAFKNRVVVWVQIGAISQVHRDIFI